MSVEISGAEKFRDFDFLLSSTIDRIICQEIEMNPMSLETEKQEPFCVKMTERCNLPIFKKENTTGNT